MSKRPKQSRRREGLRRKKKRALTPRRIPLGELSLWLLIAAAGLRGAASAATQRASFRHSGIGDSLPVVSTG